MCFFAVIRPSRGGGGEKCRDVICHQKGWNREGEHNALWSQHEHGHRVSTLSKSQPWREQATSQMCDATHET